MIVNSNNKILILEDNLFVVELLSEQLERVYTTRPIIKITNQLAEFMSVCSHQPFDVFIVDLNVVDARASEVAARLSELPVKIRERVVIHSSETWSNLTRLGLTQFKRVQKGPTDSELKAALNDIRGHK